VAAGVLVLGRVPPLLARSEPVLDGLLVVGLASIVVGGVLALAQDELKQRTIHLLQIPQRPRRLRVLGDWPFSLFFGRDYTAPSRSKRVSRGVTRTGHLALRNRALVTLPRRTAPSGP
jgi:hypothetical protein